FPAILILPLTPLLQAATAMQGSYLVFLEQHANTTGKGFDNFVLAGNHGRDINRQSVHFNAMFGKFVPGTLEILRRFKQCLGRNTTDIQAGSSQTGFALPIFPVINTYRFESKLCTADSSHITTGT